MLYGVYISKSANGVSENINVCRHRTPRGVKNFLRLQGYATLDASGMIVPMGQAKFVVYYTTNPSSYQKKDYKVIFRTPESEYFCDYWK